jgi:biopolymer transport protein TolQ
MGPDAISITVAQAQGGGVDMSVVSAISHAGPIGIAVLLILVAFSIASWGIILLKFLSIRSAGRSSLQFLETFWESKRLDDIFQQSESMVNSPIAQVFRAGYQELVKVKQKEQRGDSALLGGADNVERALRRAATSEMTELGRLVPFLATVGSTSPFIGLFGTVVGIMRSFREIGLEQSANLAVVAPGIAEALIATAAGLAAAIPAVMAFNFFNSRMKNLGHEMDNFSADFMNIVRRHFF